MRSVNWLDKAEWVLSIVSDLRLEGRLCCKEILPALATNASTDTEIEQLSQQFRTEASTLARLDHPNLPKVSDYFTIQNREYLVMDFVEGAICRRLCKTRSVWEPFSMKTKSLPG